MINQTFEVMSRNYERFIVQRMHPAFNEQTLEDQDVVCKHLQMAGFNAPSLICRWKDKEDRLWKVTKLIKHDKSIGQTTQTVTLASRYLSEIHTNLKELIYIPRPAIQGFHDTTAIMNKLAAHIDNAAVYGIDNETDFVLQQNRRVSLPHESPSIIHGDPKWNNFLFDSCDGSVFVSALIDWDTVMIGNPYMDIGDMIRSLCKKPDGSFDHDRFKIIANSYREGIEFCEQALVAAKVITLELTARFLIDVIDDTYFDFDRSKFSTRRDSNIAAARKYISYYRSM